MLLLGVIWAKCISLDDQCCLVHSELSNVATATLSRSQDAVVVVISREEVEKCDTSSVLEALNTCVRSTEKARDQF